MCKFWVFASRYLVAQTRSCFVSKTMFTPAIPYLEEYDPFDWNVFQGERNRNLARYHIGRDTTSYRLIIFHGLGHVRNDMLRFKRLSKCVRNCGLGASHARASIEFCNTANLKHSSKNCKAAAHPVSRRFFCNVVSGGETGFMELPHIFLMKCTRHRSCYLHGVVCSCLELLRLFMFARNIPKMHHFFLCGGASISYPYPPGN